MTRHAAPLGATSRVIRRIKRAAGLPRQARAWLLTCTAAGAVVSLCGLAWVQATRGDPAVPGSAVPGSAVRGAAAPLSQKMLEEQERGFPEKEEAEDVDGDPEVIDDLDLSLALRDASQLYAKHPFAVVGADWQEMSARNVCLATHASIDHLHHVVDSAAFWTAPISVAVFTPDVDYQLSRLYIRYLRECFPDVLRKVSFHAAYPVSRPARWDPELNLEVDLANCSEPTYVLERLLASRSPEMMKWRTKLPYPQNMMRNLARSACPGMYIICPDVDMVVTVDGLDKMLEDFMQRKQQTSCKRCAYVIPVYEVKEEEDPPTNKTQLLLLVKQKKARPFHVQVFWPNQGLSNLRAWERRGQAPALGVAHPVQKFAFFYEPLYVAQRGVPPFDERFVGFGHTRNTQAYEMFMAGWQFFVLNNAFLVHWGFQKTSQRPPWRWSQASVNARRFPGFVREVAVRYDRDPLNMLAKNPMKNAHLVVKPAETKEAKLAPVGAPAAAPAAAPVAAPAAAPGDPVVDSADNPAVDTNNVRH